MSPGGVGYGGSLCGPVLPINAADAATVVEEACPGISDGYPVFVPRTRPSTDGVRVQIVRRRLEEELVRGRAGPCGLHPPLPPAPVDAARGRFGRLPCRGAAIERPVVILALVPLPVVGEGHLVLRCGLPRQ